MSNLTASPTKLRNGNWGASVSGAPSVGEIVTISTRSGKTWDARVTRVLWTGDSKYGDGTVSICATESVESRPAPQRSRRGGCPTDGNCSSMYAPGTGPCGVGGWFRCC